MTFARTAHVAPGAHDPQPSGEDARKRTLDVVGGYIALTKPRIIELLLLTTVPAMFLAQRGVPSLTLVLWTLVGGSLAAGSANALNCVVDADIDQKMRRTSRRPLPRHKVGSRGALVFGLALGLLATALLAWQVNWVSAWLALAANAFYVLVYTMVLKRRTSQNIVWGGLAGCFPPLIGWTAVTGHVALAPVVMFLVVFFWTPPHFWALGLRYREDYAAANVPMLPSVAPAAEVGRQIVMYTWATVATSLTLWWVGNTGWFYLSMAIVLGIIFLIEAYDLKGRTDGTEDLAVIKPMRLFHFSNGYLALLFVAMAVDPFIK